MNVEKVLIELGDEFLVTPFEGLGSMDIHGTGEDVGKVLRVPSITRARRLIKGLEEGVCYLERHAEFLEFLKKEKAKEG